MNSENLFEYYEEESEQGVPISEKSYSIGNVQQEEPNKVLDHLKKIQEQMHQLTDKLDKLEECMKSVMETQVVLNNNQVVIVGNQQAIATKLETMEENMMIRPEMLAQVKSILESKISIKKIEGSVSRITGEEKSSEAMNAVAAYFPLKSTAEVVEIEKKLENTEFAQAMTTYLLKLKAESEDVGTVTRSIFKDSLMERYNWDGRCKKHALIKLRLFDKFLRDVFQKPDFEKSLRKAVDKSHNRFKQLRYLRKQKQQQCWDP